MKFSISLAYFIKLADALELFWSFSVVRFMGHKSNAIKSKIREGPMSATAFIRKYVFNLPEGKIFTTRDCVKYGFRAAVDEALYRLVKGGIIRRLCRGVFVRDTSGQLVFSDYEIAKVKAESFGRKLAHHADNLAVEMLRTSKSLAAPTFAINNRSTSFRYGEKVIHLRETCERKMILEDDKPGRALRVLWQVGRDEQQISRDLVAKVIGAFAKGEREGLMLHAKWIPGWLNDSFKYLRRWETAEAV
jgi:hypothetical protein